MIEKEIFKRTKIDYDKLIKYGFRKEGKEYKYSKNILDTFKVEVTIDDKVNAKIIDLEFNEEYTNHKVEKNNGEFVNKVRDEYRKVLEDIRDNCTYNNNFIFEQTNRVEKYIYKKYKDKPEFLWKKSEGFGVFRNKNNKKWYGIIMNLDKSKIDNGSGEIEIINVKLDNDMITDLIKQKGFYKAYHMNKKSWITIILDETLDDEIIFSLIDNSYEIVNG